MFHRVAISVLPPALSSLANVFGFLFICGHGAVSLLLILAVRGCWLIFGIEALTFFLLEFLHDGFPLKHSFAFFINCLRPSSFRALMLVGIYSHFFFDFDMARILSAWMALPFFYFFLALMFDDLF